MWLLADTIRLDAVVVTSICYRQSPWSYRVFIKDITTAVCGGTLFRYHGMSPHVNSAGITGISVGLDLLTIRNMAPVRLHVFIPYL